MANEHPFQHLFETLGRIPTFHSESVNRQAYEVLSDILSVPVEKSGRCILLRAPRAGHGKTHLLSRIQHQLGASHEFIPLHASFGCRIDAATVIDDTLRRLVRQLPASGGLCVLDLVTRRLFASALQPLVSSGEVPCQDREGALAALRMRPIETFDFHHPNAVTAHWARENFEVLGQRLGMELAQRGNLPVREVSFWVDLLFRFAAAPLENTSRVRLLAEAVHGGAAEEMERLEALLGLVAQLMRVVLVADDLEGFSSDETAALRLAAFLGQLRQSVDRLDVILSLNQDIWHSAFLPRLSGGLADRLSEVVVELEPLKDSEMAALLDSRVPGLGNRVLDKIDRGSAGTHARGLIRAAGLAWLKATAMDSTPPADQAPLPEPPPVETPLPSIVPLAAAQETLPISEPSLPVAEISPEQEPVFQEAQLPEVAPEFQEPVFAGAIESEGDTPPPAIGQSEPELSSAFTFSSEAVPPVESPASWPVPEFSPPPAVAPVDHEHTPVVEAPEASAFQVDAVAFSPAPAEIPVAAVEQPAPWNPSAVVPTHQLPKTEGRNLWDLDDDIASEPAVVFASPSGSGGFPSGGSPFQAAAEQASPSGTFDQAFTPPVPEPEPQPAAPFTPQGWQESPSIFSPAPAVEAPVEIVPQTPFEAAPAVTGYSQQPPASPFQSAPAESPFAPAVSPFQPAPAEPSPAPVQPAFQAAAEPVETAQDPAQPSAADTDRVDDLLRQFRERYGRGSL